MENFSQLSLTVLLSIILIIALNSQLMLSQANSFDDCSRILKTISTTNEVKHQNGEQLKNKIGNELINSYQNCLKAKNLNKQSVKKSDDDLLVDGMRFRRNKRSVLEGEGMRFKKDPILDEEGMRFKKDSLLNEEGMRFRKKSVLDGEGMRFKKDQLLDEEGMRFKKSVLDGEGMRFKKGSVLDGEGMRFKKDQILDEEGLRFRKKSVLDGEGMRFKKGSVLDGEGFRFKKSFLNWKKNLQKINYRPLDETSDERREGGSSSDILEERNYFN